MKFCQLLAADLLGIMLYFVTAAPHDVAAFLDERFLLVLAFIPWGIVEILCTNTEMQVAKECFSFKPGLRRISGRFFYSSRRLPVCCAGGVGFMLLSWYLPLGVSCFCSFRNWLQWPVVSMSLLMIISAHLIVIGIGIRLQQPKYITDTGFYSIVRHPSYVGSILISFGFVLGFNCLAGFCLSVVMNCVGFVTRIMEEERTILSSSLRLPYENYMSNVPSRLLPFFF